MTNLTRNVFAAALGVALLACTSGNAKRHEPFAGRAESASARPAAAKAPLTATAASTARLAKTATNPPLRCEGSRAFAGPLTSVVRLPSVGGVRTAVAVDANKQAVMIALGASGAWQATKLPAWSEEVAVAGSRLFFLEERETGPRIWHVDVADLARPTVGQATVVRGLGDVSNVKGFATDGTVALVSTYHRNHPRAMPKYRGRTALFSVASGKRIGADANFTVWDAACAKGTCVGWATPNVLHQGDQLVALSEQGVSVIESLPPGIRCGAISWQVGDDWVLAMSREDHIDLVQVSMKTRKTWHQRKLVPSSPKAKCSSLLHLEVQGEHGIVYSQLGRWFFMPVGPRLTLGTRRPLGDVAERSAQVAAVGDAIVLLDYSADQGMMHGPPDADGSYEYNEVWSFAGRVSAFAEASGGSAKAIASKRLPHDGEDGDFGRGYEPLLLGDPRHLGVLMVSDVGGTQWMPFLPACR